MIFFQLASHHIAIYLVNLVIVADEVIGSIYTTLIHIITIIA